MFECPSSPPPSILSQILFSLPPSLTRSTRSFLPISNKTYLEQRLMRISSAVRYGKRLRVGGHAATGATVMSDVGSMVDCLFILFLGFDYFAKAMDRITNAPREGCEGYSVAHTFDH